MTQPNLYLELPLTQDWGAIGPLRESLADRLAPALGDREEAKLLAMVASELLENAVKFGRWTDRLGHRGQATLRVVAEGTDVSVTVTNPVDPERPGVMRLLDQLRELAAMAPSAAYQLRLRALLQDPDAAPSGLGLARMAHEAGCQLSAWVTAAGVLHVRAQVHR